MSFVAIYFDNRDNVVSEEELDADDIHDALIAAADELQNLVAAKGVEWVRVEPGDD